MCIMPVLEKIVVQDFRNIELQELEFSPNINCISGNNGEGKTNLMDAIYYLSMTKSAFSTSEKFNFRYGQKSFSIAGTYSMPNGLSSRFTVQVTDQGEKRMRRDDKPYPKISDHIGEIPIVMVSPSDISLVSDSGEERRKFVNSVLSQMDREYLTAAQNYNRMLMQRNKVLKDAGFCDESLFAAIDMQMSRTAQKIFEARDEFTRRINPLVQSYYERVSGGHETVSIEYRSDLQKESLEEAFARNRGRDMALRYTSAGVQRDDFVFLMNGYPIRKCGSQGQQKSFLVSLKFAQYELMKENYGFAPILLLDDLFDKLDMTRVSNLLKMVAGNDFGQIFLSDSNKVRITGIVDSITADRAYFETSSGSFTRL